jgi:ribose transport system ATP-binding protein
VCNDRVLHTEMTADKSNVSAVVAEHVSKTFPSQKALDDVTFEVKAGEVHALLGANGSGKSTLIKILSGFHVPDEGSEVRVEGKPLPFGAGGASHEAGLRFVHQTLALIPEFNAVENIALDTGYTRPRWLDWKAQAAESRRLLDRLGVEMDIWRPLSQCRAVERTAVAIARVINLDHGHVSCVVLDEPTSRLPEPEVEQLFRIIRELRDSGIAVVYVTHRMDEVPRIADRVSVLREGRMQATEPTRDVTRERLVELIVGQSVARHRVTSTVRKAADAELLRVDGLSAGSVRDVSLTLREGEILGVVGLAGSGHEDIARALVGALKWDAGSVWLKGKRLLRLDPRAALECGIALGLSNTMAGSAVREFTVAENVTMSSLGRHHPRLRPLRKRSERRAADRWISDLDVRPPDPNLHYKLLSGGNQQKVILARCLATAPSVLVLENPTAGVDVGARQVVYGLIAEEAKRGLGVVVCSEDLEDVLSTCHRVLVIRAGQVVAVVEGKLDDRQLMSLAAHGVDDGDSPLHTRDRRVLADA